VNAGIEAALVNYERTLADHAGDKAAAPGVRDAVAAYNDDGEPSMAAADTGDIESDANILNAGPPDKSYDGVKAAGS